ncbi:hypothetical protein ASD11_00485 [Aeromicrobium sp. Root495]|uniref:hypothetical protein n=1 Tax=Aeromicrobium sp. Root495 TaxID=1736550 RepID=UPI0006F93241|nr:hypothetical protein [Aeromicrobium sp. Root495]KQY58183.1 hypothetical protein ASD11_00485 [Aeromicrobium sp. Root495]
MRAGTRSTVTAAVLVVVVLGQALVVWSLAAGRPSLHHADVVVAGPDAVARLAADDLRERGGGRLDAVAVASTRDAERAVADGRAVAGYVIDLRDDRTRVLLSAANGGRLDAQLRDQGLDVLARYTSTHDVAYVGEPPGEGPSRGLVRTSVLAAVVLGWLLAIVATVRAGPVDDTFLAGLGRVARLAAGSVGLGVVALVVGLAAGAGPWLGVVVAASALVAAVTTTALESLLGVYGIAVATFLFVLSAGPLLTGAATEMLPDPWSGLTPYLLHGGALDAADGLVLGLHHRGLHGAAVLLVWVVGSVLTLTVARRERQRAGVEL